MRSAHDLTKRDFSALTTLKVQIQTLLQEAAMGPHTMDPDIVCYGQLKHF